MMWTSWGVASTILSLRVCETWCWAIVCGRWTLKHLPDFYIHLDHCSPHKQVCFHFSWWNQFRGLSTIEIWSHDAVTLLLLNINQRRHAHGWESWITAYHSTWVMARSVPAQIIKCQKRTLILLGFVPNSVPFLPLVTAELSNVSIAIRPLFLRVCSPLACVCCRIKGEKMVMAEKILSRANKVSQITVLSIHFAGAEFLLLSPGACW